ncbi:MAG: hypothetical protein JWO08_3562, partial [Verrucomicrobiaceae bacterium]|nr:hypothetical protein [Verrucomicrobiaceae bacterium]
MELTARPLSPSSPSQDQAPAG